MRSWRPRIVEFLSIQRTLSGTYSRARVGMELEGIQGDSMMDDKDQEAVEVLWKPCK
jgi:hypothetical protein